MDIWQEGTMHTLYLAPGNKGRVRLAPGPPAGAAAAEAENEPRRGENQSATHASRLALISP